MRPHEFLAVALLCAPAAALADPADYGKVDTFQPGKKYNCVPTADRKGWDCRLTGNANVPPAAKPAQPLPATPPPAAPPAKQAGALPGYLTHAGANPLMQPMAAVPAPKPAPKPRIKGPMVPERTPAPKKPAPKPAPTPAAAPAPVLTRSVPTAPTPKPASVAAAQDFLALPATSYVIELTHTDSKAGLNAARAAGHPAHGKVYELHLRQNGIDAWLLLWGPFDDLQSARAARDGLVAQGATPGWPRQVGPLQAEARRLQP